MGIRKCKLCKGKLVECSWEQKVVGALCPVGTYKYYECEKCLMRYTSAEVEK